MSQLQKANSRPRISEEQLRSHQPTFTIVPSLKWKHVLPSVIMRENIVAWQYQTAAKLPVLPLGHNPSAAGKTTHSNRRPCVRWFDSLGTDGVHVAAARRPGPGVTTRPLLSVPLSTTPPPLALPPTPKYGEYVSGSSDVPR
ncbi:hypothetical protein E2C01_055561 [Portunus trituberculatus]|uniref:Uncharacterized protein n=1 Tax=Portunus trituberculatus TaxID=210409 RepID=A0A5B7GVC5_PORTR|nr:hypothetical protein [Portunus trituberculatus]